MGGLSLFTPTHHLLGFAAGMATLGLPVGYPAHRWEVLAALPVVAAVLWWLAARQTTVYGTRVVSAGLLLGAVVAGCLYGDWRMGAALQARVPQCADASPRRFLVTVEADARAGLDGIARFIGRVDASSQDPDCEGLDNHRVRLTWYDAPALVAGQIWQVDGKLRPPWGYRNPGGFDYERWLLGVGLHGTGYIRAGTLLTKGGEEPIPWLTDIRSALTDWVDSQHIRHGALVLALLTGDDSRISSEQWEWLRRSGTIHLVVVSGLHVGMIAGCLLLAGRWLVRLSPWLLARYGARRPASLVALLGSGCYVLISGMGIPAVRSWLMTAVALLAIGGGRRIAPGQALALVVVVVLVHDPLAVHQQGFWLSFTAVAALLGFFLPRGSPVGAASKVQRGSKVVSGFLQAQLVLLLALGPLLALTQGSVPLHSPLANGLVVPLVTMAILPLILLSGGCAFLMPGVAGSLLWLADVGLESVMRVVVTASAIAPASAVVGGGFELVLMGGCVATLGLAPGIVRGLPLVLLWFGLLLPASDPIGSGSFRVLAMDVGQGSAILIETRAHRLLYDAGPGFPSGFNLGEAAVVPSYFRRHTSPLDGLVLSHDDVDHTGGFEAIVDVLEPTTIWRSFGSGGRCGVGQRWEWDGVTFEFLHPSTGSEQRASDSTDARRASDNDQSCVLLVSGADRRALLAGDISRAVERRLDLPPVDLLFAPHHGSRTSSSVSFVRRTRPLQVFISTSRRSRYGHPHPAVLHRYRTQHSTISVTGWHGALEWDSSEPESVVRWREDERAYWHSSHQPDDDG